MKHMNWRHKKALSRFVPNKPRSFSGIPRVGERVGEKTWKTLIEKGWIEPEEGKEGARWWLAPYVITDAGQKALKSEEA